MAKSLSCKEKRHDEKFAIVIVKNHEIKKEFFNSEKKLEHRLVQLIKNNSFEDIRTMQFRGIDKENNISVYDYFDFDLKNKEII